MSEPFAAPFGRAILRLEGLEEIPTRVIVDLKTNTLLCSLPSFEPRLRLNTRASLRELELITETNRWRAADVPNLQIVESGGGRMTSADTELGKSTGQDGPPFFLRLARNGQQEFTLERPVSPAIEFEGGFDLPYKIDLGGGIVLSSRNGRALLEAEDESLLLEASTRLALSLAFGRLCWTRFSASGIRLTMTFQQRLERARPSGAIFDVSSGGYLSHEKLVAGVKEVFNRARASLLASTSVAPRADLLIEWFLASRNVAGLVDFRALALFSFLEMLDESPTLTRDSLSKLLRVHPSHGKALANVRHEVSHGHLSLVEALRAETALDVAFFGNLVLGDYHSSPTATLLNYLVYATNSLMLSRIGSALPAASWV